jgi:hypothetical protein
VKDWRGTEIEAGDTIVYAVKESTSVGLNEALVTEVGEEADWYGRPEIRVTATWLRGTYDERASNRVRLKQVRNITVIRKHDPGIPT